VLVDLSRLDIHAADSYGLTGAVDLPDEMLLSDLLVTVIVPFVPQARGLNWTCRAEVRGTWVDVAQIGSTDRRATSQLLIENRTIAEIAHPRDRLAIGCTPVWASGVR